MSKTEELRIIDLEEEQQHKIERERKSPQGSLAGKGKGRPGKGPEALIAVDTLYLSK